MIKAQKYRKKPVVIEAMAFIPENWPDILDFLGWEWVEEDKTDEPPHQLVIETLEGEMTAKPGDWIIKGVEGEYYPCKPSVFNQSYESA